jgi:hypothetical protein
MAVFCRRTGVAVASDGRCICTDIRDKAVSCVPDCDGTGRDPLNGTGTRHGLLRVRIGWQSCDHPYCGRRIAMQEISIRVTRN